MSLIFQRLFLKLKAIKQILLLFLSYLACTHLGYLRTDMSGIDQVSLFHLTTFRYHSPSYHSRQFVVYLTCKLSAYE